MPQITLPSASVAYNLYAKAVAADPTIRRNSSCLTIQFPAVAANAGATLKIGTPNADQTDVPSPDTVLAAGESYTFPATAPVSLTTKWLKADANNAVVGVSAEPQ